MKQRTAVWKSLDYDGLEHLTLREYTDHVTVDSVVIGLPPEGAFRLNYQVRCDGRYRVRTVRVSLKDGATLHLTGDGHGNWSDQNRQLLPDLQGCIDIDISATPFTNTLPVRRLSWTPGQTETLRMVYFSIPEMTIHADEQRYTCAEQTTNGAVFRFEQVSTGFTALLPVDTDGLVLDYPQLFKRVLAG